MANGNANRFFNLGPETPADVAQAIRYLFNVAQDHYEAFKALKAQTAVVTTKTVAASTSGVPAVTAVPKFSDAEVVAGSGTSWTLATTPSPAASLILVQKVFGGPGGGIILVEGTDYTLLNDAITTVNSLTAGDLTAWYRF